MSTFKNFVQCRVTTPITAVANSIGLYAAVPPYTLPSEEGGLLVLTDSPTKPSKLEVISYTSRSELGLYGVTRGLEGTTAQEWTGPVYCYQSLLAGEFKTLLDSKVDKVTGKQLSDENYTQDEKTKLAGLDAALETMASKTELTTGLGLKVDVELGKGLSDTNFTQVEKDKLSDVAVGATKNRADSENADKVHTHTTSHVNGLDTALSYLETSVEVLDTALSDLRSDLGASTISYNYSTHTYDLSKHRITTTHKACRRCLLSDDGNVNYYLDQHDSNKKEDGTTAVLTGGDGQVMVEIPRFWFGVNHIGETIQLTQSPIPLPGLIPHPVFTTGGDFDAVYVGAYDATVQKPDGTIIPGLNLDNNTARVSLAADKLSSLSGGDNYAMVGLNLDEFRTLANNRGEGWDEFSFLAWQALQVLGYTFLGSFNGQAALGNGNVTKSYPASSSIQSDSSHTLNGASNILGNEAGATNDFMSLLGVENLWGQCWQWVDGVLFQDAQAYVSAVPASTITADYYPVGSPISQAGASGGYISKFQKLVNSIMIPGAGPGDSSRFVGDSFLWAGGLRGAYVGGRATDGARCGLAYLVANDAPGSRYRHIGGRVMFKRSRG